MRTQGLRHFLTQVRMKRTSSSLTPPPQGSPDRATVAVSTASTTEQPPEVDVADLITDDTPDEVVTALRQQALQSGDHEALSVLLAVRPQLPMQLHMDASTLAETVCTLVHALPDDSPSPSIELSGSLPDQTPIEALTTLFTHPTLSTLSLTRLVLTREDVASVASAVRTTPSALTSLSCSDDMDCLLDPGFADLIEALGSLRRLQLANTGGGYNPMGADGPAALRLAQVLLDKALDAIELHDFGPFMEPLRCACTDGHVPAWEALTLSCMGLTPNDTREITELTVVLAHGLAAPDLRALTLKGFFIREQDVDDPAGDTLVLDDFFFDEEDPEPPAETQGPCSGAAYSMARALAEALSRRRAPLQVTLESADIEVLNLLMGGFTGHPAEPGASLTTHSVADSPRPGGAHCLRALSIVWQPDLGDLVTTMPDTGPHPSVDGFLQGMAAWVTRLDRLDSLTVTLDPVQAARDGITGPIDVAPMLAAGSLSGLAEALAHTHLTSLTFDGALLTPVPDLLHPCLQRVHAHAIHVELQTSALDVCFDFLYPGQVPHMHLPAELGRRLVTDIGASRPHPMTTLPALTRRQLTSFVDRYNELVRRENARRPDPMPRVPEHPLTATIAGGAGDPG